MDAAAANDRGDVPCWTPWMGARRGAIYNPKTEGPRINARVAPRARPDSQGKRMSTRGVRTARRSHAGHAGIMVMVDEYGKLSLKDVLLRRSIGDGFPTNAAR